MSRESDNKALLRRWYDEMWAHCAFDLIPEGDYVTSVGTWKINGTLQWDWVQTFRIEAGRIVETWLPGFATEGRWDASELPS